MEDIGFIELKIVRKYDSLKLALTEIQVSAYGDNFKGAKDVELKVLNSVA